MVLGVLVRNHLKIFFSIFRVRKQDTWVVMFATDAIPVFLACEEGPGVGPSTANHQVESHDKVSFPKITTSVLLVFSLRQFAFIQSATLVIQGMNLFPVV